MALFHDRKQKTGDSPTLLVGFACLIFILPILIGLSPTISAQEWIGNVISDPAISKRCNELSKKRQQKLEHKQKLMALHKRNTSAQKGTPKNRKTIKTRLEINEGQLKQEINLTRLVIEQLEENIIRKGCPGISL